MLEKIIKITLFVGISLIIISLFMAILGAMFSIEYKPYLISFRFLLVSGILFGIIGIISLMYKLIFKK